MVRGSLEVNIGEVDITQINGLLFFHNSPSNMSRIVHITRCCGRRIHSRVLVGIGSRIGFTKLRFNFPSSYLFLFQLRFQICDCAAVWTSELGIATVHEHSPDALVVPHMSTRCDEQRLAGLGRLAS